MNASSFANACVARAVEALPIPRSASRFSRALQSEAAQPWLERLSAIRARAVVDRAKVHCPAYRQFLSDCKTPGRVALHDLPPTDKANYVQAYPLEARCYGGTIPIDGTILDESSGSSGAATDWVRGRAERDGTRALLQATYRRLYGNTTPILINCFALGPWATGLSVSFSLADVGILKSLGPDQAKLEQTLLRLGPGYPYLILGYPPFLKQFVDTTTLDLSQYRLDAVVGGEGMSEPLRRHLSGPFQTVLSSYGASDLEINIGLETPFTQRLRRLCEQDGDLCQSLFGRDTPPMLFQYNPLAYYIETADTGELHFTVCRLKGAAPKIRYNLHDCGGTLTFRALAARLREHQIEVRDWPQFQSALPLLWVYGRSDCTVAFYGAKVYPGDVERVLLAHPTLKTQVSGFQIAVREDDKLTCRLLIHLEHDGQTPDSDEASRLFWDGLRRANQDFREVSRLFASDAIEVIWHDPGEGPFAGRDTRIKRRYIA